jgi:hypothetical protein
MGIRDEYAAKEAASWEALLAQIGRLTPEQQAKEGVVPGWSTKDLLWHCAYWTNDVVQQLPALMDGSFVDPFEADDTLGDRMNADVAEESKALTSEEAMARSIDARRALLDAWAGLSEEPTPAAADWYADESFIHYDEHAIEISKFADSLGA